MRGLPSFTIDSPLAFEWRAAVAVLALGSAGGVVPWLAALAAERPAAASGLAVLALGLLGVGLTGMRVGSPALRWTGSGWSCDAGAVAVEAEVDPAVDLGDWMLLVVRPRSEPGRRTWMALSAREFGGERWHALRCAVRAGARRDG